MPSSQMGEGEKQHSPRAPTPSLLSMSSPDLSSTESPSLKDMVTDAVRIIHQLCKNQHEVPKAVYSRILLTLQSDYGVIDMAGSGNWLDGGIWAQMLEAGESHSHRTTILNLLGYMGAWEWFDRQVKLAEMTVYTGNNTLVKRNTAASYVLDSFQDLQININQPSKSIRGLGLLTFGEGEKTSENALGPAECATRRSRFRTHLRRGRKVREEIVKELLGFYSAESAPTFG